MSWAERKKPPPIKVRVLGRLDCEAFSLFAHLVVSWLSFSFPRF